MKIHLIQHVAFENSAYLHEWASQRQVEVSTSTLYASPSDFPDLAEIDLLFVLGGPMSIHDTEKYPWLEAEQDYIRQAIEADKAVIGICLGAQLIANVLGADVYPNTQKEIGWYEVKRVLGCGSHPIADYFPLSFTPLHWHGEMFDIPQGATHLLQSVACSHQAFAYGDRVLALQFHLEMAPQDVEHILLHCADEVGESQDFVQLDDVIRQGISTYNHANRTLFFDLMDYMHRLLTDGLRHYVPIACHEYDRIEIYIMKRKQVQLTYWDEARNRQMQQVRLIDTLVKDNQEFVVLETGEKIRMDAIISMEVEEEGNDYGLLA